MTKLLNAYFSRLSKWTIFRILLPIMICGGVIGAIAARDMPVAWNAAFMVAYLIFPHYVGVIVGLFNYPLFTNGTIRNQISVGHKRQNIFFADWAASNAFASVLFLVFSAAFYTVLAIVGNSSNVSLKALLLGLAFSLLHVILFTTISQLFCVMFKGVKSFLAIYLGNQALIIAGVGVNTLAMKNDVPDGITALFPTAIGMRLTGFEVESLLAPAMVTVLAEIAIVFILGLLYFYRTDIN